MKKEMFALAFELLLAFGSQGQFAEELPPADGGSGFDSPPLRQCKVADTNISEGTLTVTCITLGGECITVNDCVKGTTKP